ncbi:MAG: TGS domain-containing protein [candidate division Zixibacteria bacterium]|nr:TGS domain-containing protein [candidate division Zixibacteria bacterium]NIR67996.1 TGS domain-containing protein [candidate division Zixibacteria bacterium]NIS17496.1 TGS domain-containing protein [candidate division Zixibacteria bacterium]NIS49202.1 TGS domain-containing protein [candidate division Zixibacteria bacterium]NIT53805.1 TGS domain-containing protein [candidate division Zixibacteria bacterium]
MPANLTPQYKEAEERFRNASSDEERLACLEEMMRVIPKHKGTEKMRADIKTRMSKIRQKLESGKKSKGGGARRTSYLDHVEKHGAAQIIILGPPNSGKSSLVKLVTNTEPEIADYPFTTRTPMPAMMPYKTIQFQLVDMPPVSKETYDGWMTNLIRNGDMIVIVVDVSADDLLESLDETLEVIKDAGIVLTGETIPEEYENSVFCKKTLILANKIGEEKAPDIFQILQEFYGEKFPILGISVHRNRNIEQFKSRIFEMLKIIRVYTKSPGKEVDYKDPIILPIGATVEDAALSIHKDFAEKLQYAKVWGEGKFDGQRVTNSFQLADGDIIEFHI